VAPAGVPAADVLPGDAELAGNLGLGAAGGKQLIGHSMGGDVVVEAARRLGDRVAGLVWVDTYGTLGGRVSS
jgi:pimeloyl-ACP methyl ester carboxylesterase